MRKLSLVLALLIIAGHLLTVRGTASQQQPPQGSARDQTPSVPVGTSTGSVKSTTTAGNGTTPATSSRGISPTAASMTAPPPAPTYDGLVSAGYDLLKDGKVQEAYTAALSAASINGTRFEAYALAALALHSEGAEQEASQFVGKALAVATDDKKPKLNELAKVISDAIQATSKASAQAKVDPELRRKKDVLELIMNDVDHAANPEARKKLLQELLDRSGPFLKDYPDQVNVWVLSGAAAVELDDPRLAWEAGQALKKLKADVSDDPNIRRFMASLERKGWLGDKPPLSREDEVEQRRAAISGAWRCSERLTFEFLGDGTLDPFTNHDVSTSYMETTYSVGRFTMDSVLSETKTPAILTDGVSRPTGSGESDRQRKAVWQGEILTLTETGSGGAFRNARYQLVNGVLNVDDENEFSRQHFTSHDSCERLSLQEATDAVNKLRTNIRTALDDLMQFVRANALKVSNLTATSNASECKLKWTGPGLYLNDPVNPKETSVLRDVKYEVERDEFAEAYHVNFNFWFRTPELANHYVQLAKKAGELCHDGQ